MAPSSERRTVCVLVGAASFEQSPHPFPELPVEKIQGDIDMLARLFTRERRRKRQTVEIVRLVDARHPDEIRAVLEQRPARPPDLLVCYYVGHGYRDPDDRDRLYLALTGSRADRISRTALAADELVDLLNAAGADQTVVILDCCYSGDVARLRLPLGEHFAMLTSSREGMLISPGADSAPLTPFTAALVEVLGEGPRYLYNLATRLHELSQEPANEASAQHPFPWFPAEHSVSGGAGIVLPPSPDVQLEPPPEGDAIPPGGPPPLPLWYRIVLRLPAPLMPGSWGCIALVMVVVSAFVLAGVLLAGHTPGTCPPPLELRMAAAPEDVGAMRELTGEFERSGANHHDADGASGCRIAAFTVYGASLDALSGAFRHSGTWATGPSLSEVGPQPDVWVAQSSAEVTRVREAARPPKDVRKADFLGTGSYSLMSDAPVLVLTERARAGLGLAAATGGREQQGEEAGLTWQELRAAYEALGEDAWPRLLRPNPAVSGAGLVHALGMYARDWPVGGGRGGWLPEKEIDRLETGAISQGRSTAGSDQALCGVAEGDASGALVTRQQVDSYDKNPAAYCAGAGAVRGTRGGRGPGDLHRYRLRGGPVLDYPLVEVGWPVGDRERRADAVAAFRRWAASGDGAGHIAEHHFGRPARDGSPLSGRAIGEQLARFRDAHPDLRLTVLFDVSGSMRERGRFKAAYRVVEASLSRLAPSDRYRLITFPGASDPAASRERTHGWRAVRAADFPLLKETDLLPADAREADLRAVLGGVADDLQGGGRHGGKGEGAEQHAVLVVTDGDYRRGEPPRTGALKALAGELGGRDVPLIVASMRPYGCARGKDTGALSDGPTGTCAPLTGDLEAELSRHVAALTQGRREG